MARTGYIQSLYRGIRERSSDFRFEVFAKQFLPVPPRSEQDQIVRYLDWQVSKINRLILAKKKEIELVRECIDREFRNITITNCQQIKIKRLFKLENNMIEPVPDEYYQKAGMYNRGRGIFLREPCVGAELGDSSFQIIFKDRVMLSGQFAWEDAEPQLKAGSISPQSARPHPRAVKRKVVFRLFGVP